MRLKSAARQLLTTTALLASLTLPLAASAQIFYNEVTKDGRIYVFANAQKYDAFQKDSSETGAVIIRPGYGPNGETVAFDSEDAVNLYNYKHGLPGEVFKKPPAPAAPSAYPAGKFSGLMFGDYYFYAKYHQDQISSTNSARPENQNGFWLRRIYFTYDLALSEKFTTRFRIEMNSNGQFTNSNLVPFVKDAYLRWNYRGKQQATLGIQPSTSIDWVEGFWGMRHIEKTPADLYRIDSSRDFALSSAGPARFQNLSYTGQFGNDSGNGSETDRYKILRFEGRYEKNPGLALEAYYSYAWHANNQDRATAQAFAGYRHRLGRAGAQYIYQRRDTGNNVQNTEIHIWSVYGIWDVKPKKADLFARVDGVMGKSGQLQHAGLPGADGIDFLILSPNADFTTLIAGGEWYLHPSIRVGPNVEWVSYKDEPDPANFEGRDQDLIYRFTFFWTL